MSRVPQIPPAATSTGAPLLDAETAWQQLIARDPRAQFFYGVTTTGVFCRPTCSSRRPGRGNVRFFGSAAEALSAGFRPCLRCRPTADAANPVDKIRAHIEAHLDRPVRLRELGRVAGLSPFTVQRLFKQAMGLSPLAYQRALRAFLFRASLKQGESVTNAIYSAGFSSPSRAYEAASLGMTPARFARGGRGERIGFATSRSPFGWIVAGATARGLCWLSLASTAAEAESSLRAEFPLAELSRDPAVAHWIEAAVESVQSGAPSARTAMSPVQSDSSSARTATSPVQNQSPTELDLRGTAFQLRVWQALCRIPRGRPVSYSELARSLGMPNAARAVARACALNRVALLVPCHRVVGAGGSLTGYRWGIERKRQLLAAERATEPVRAS